MNKMIINHLDKLFVTSDSATIIKEMEVQHPAAKMVVMASDMQEKEIGDGSNFVICLAGSLLTEAAELIKMGLHPSEILHGYEIASQKSMEYLKDMGVWKVNKKDMTLETLRQAIKTVVASKLLGFEDALAPLIAKACLTVLPTNPYNFNVDNVRVQKILGGSIHDSEVIKGVVIPQGVIGSLKEVKNAKIAIYTCSIAPAETETKGTVLIHNAKELMNYNVSEEKELEKTIKAIKDSGVDVIVTGGTVDDMAKHFLVKFGIMCLKLTSKFELRRLCRAVKARPIVTLGPCMPEHQGFCSRVHVREVGSRTVTVFTQEEKDESTVATILLRASTHNVLNDVERAIDDGVNLVKAMGKQMPCEFVPGGGATEIALAAKLQQFGSKSSGLDQYAIKHFGKALEVVPTVLAENAGYDAMEILSQLYAAHAKGQSTTGVDIKSKGVCDMKEKGVLDLMLTKQQAIKLASDAVITILRVDQIIVAKPAGGPKMGGKKGHWDNDE